MSLTPFPASIRMWQGCKPLTVADAAAFKAGLGVYRKTDKPMPPLKK